LVLPCRHDSTIVEQVAPTIELLNNMDVLHPEILLQHAINPVDYKSSLVFRSAVESIRGSFIASSTVGREALVGATLERLKQLGDIVDYEYAGRVGRHDFTVVLQRDPDALAAVEVKGGEGNSINISIRPRWAREFAIWCHLDGAIVNQPAHGARAVVSRLVGEMVRRHKHVDVLFFKDVLCGTRTRPCPKYPGRESQMGLETAPDVFLFPQRIPTLEDPEPEVHSLASLRLPGLILSAFGIEGSDVARHVWQIRVRVRQLQTGKLQSEHEINYQGQVIGRFASAPWSASE
jgi:hypothetical protein